MPQIGCERARSIWVAEAKGIRSAGRKAIPGPNLQCPAESKTRGLPYHPTEFVGTDSGVLGEAVDDYTAYRGHGKRSWGAG